MTLNHEPLALRRQKILSCIGDAPTEFWMIVEATQLPKWDVLDRLRELKEAREIAIERVCDDGFSYPVFRRLNLFDLTGANV